MTVFDWAVLALLLISGVLAMYRGFTREMLSILSWAVAGAAGAYVGYTQKALARDLVKNFSVTESEQIIALGQAGIGIVVFLLVLIVVHFLTMRLSDKVLDSHVGIVDRLLGFIFGVVRGLLVVGILFSGYENFVERGAKKVTNVEFATQGAPTLRVEYTASQRSHVLRVLQGTAQTWSEALKCKDSKVEIAEQGGKITGKGSLTECDAGGVKLSGTLDFQGCDNSSPTPATASELDVGGRKTPVATCRQRPPEPYEWTRSFAWLNKSVLIEPVVSTAKVVTSILESVAAKVEKAADKQTQ
ncbi:MAG: hypothetical protein F9K44_12145 [Hyphomicrobiaceae bacterium]|nr:MAG: hypothetical protein F9K44_12145 [Hyphomicrobiaceae bacterium]